MEESVVKKLNEKLEIPLLQNDKIQKLQKECEMVLLKQLKHE
jgi:hypothetical protein